MGDESTVQPKLFPWHMHLFRNNESNHNCHQKSCSNILRNFNRNYLPLVGIVHPVFEHLLCDRQWLNLMCLSWIIFLKTELSPYLPIAPNEMPMKRLSSFFFLLLKFSSSWMLHLQSHLFQETCHDHCSTYHQYHQVHHQINFCLPPLANEDDCILMIPPICSFLSVLPFYDLYPN